MQRTDQPVQPSHIHATDYSVQRLRFGAVATVYSDQVTVKGVRMLRHFAAILANTEQLVSLALTTSVVHPLP